VETTAPGVGTPDELIGKTLVTRKCGLCHELDRVLRAEKTAAEWSQTLDRMAGFMGDPTFLSTNESSDMVDYLVNRERR